MRSVVTADALGSVGVLVAGVLVLTTGSSGWDALLADRKSVV
ncbi:hypothetical protein [Nocardioides sp.]